LGVFDACLENIRGIPQLNLRKQFVKALDLSLQRDTENANPRPANSSRVAEESGIGVDQLVRHNVLLGKKACARHLMDLRFKVTEAEFRKKFTASRYQTFFDRQPSVMGVGVYAPLIFTYAEIHQMGKYGPTPMLPDDLRTLLD
jgi:hypothetical protein